jgi:hypothetical protein
MKLLLLRCPVCQNGLQPHDDDVVLICPQCHTPILLDESGLSVYPLRYAQPTSNKPAQWRPFWLFEGLVRLTTRQTQGGGQSAAKDAERMWGVPRRLFVPAWECPVPEARQIGKQMIEKQVAVNAIERPEGAEMAAAVLTPDDARKLLDFIILTIEAERSDWLKDIRFSLEAPPPTLWAIPM